MVSEKGIMMSIEKLPQGTRGGRAPSGRAARVLLPAMRWVHRRTGNRFRGLDLVYLSTVGARSGAHRSTSLARFPDGRGGWYILASNGGAITHPAWYHNIAAHPDQVWAEVDGTRHRVAVEQLSGEERDRAWQQMTARSPSFEGYASRTDRALPVLRLTPVP